MSLKRILVVGDAGVGKTQYIRNIIGKGFEKKYIPTLGKIQEYRKERVVLYDYPGQEIYSQHKINENIDIVCYLYDMTSRMSYNNINNWKQMIYDTYGNLVKKGFGKSISVDNLDKGLFYVNYDSKTGEVVNKK